MVKLSTEEIKTQMLKTWPYKRKASIYGIPRGGWAIAQLAERMGFGTQVDDPGLATIFVDDIIDSGATKQKWLNQYPGTAFWSPYDKTKEPGLPWLVFPWESSGDSDAEDIILRQLQFIGEDPTRPGLLETPKRVVKSWKELFAGYEMSAAEILSKVFPSDSDEMVICRDIEFYSTCEHHLIPFFGTASIGYIPKGKVVGLSKLARVVEVFARRLQLQEQLTHQIAEAILEQVPGILGVGVVMRAKHLCMCGRGISKQGSSMITSSMMGVFREDYAVRSEFLRLIA